MHFKLLTREDVTISIKAVPETVEIVGNAIASGNDQEDHKVEKQIMDDVISGNVWAWCVVLITVSWKMFESYDALGCCSYVDEEEFKSVSGEYRGMVDEALFQLNEKVLEAYTQIQLRQGV